MIKASKRHLAFAVLVLQFLVSGLAFTAHAQPAKPFKKSGFSEAGPRGGYAGSGRSGGAFAPDDEDITKGLTGDPDPSLPPTEEERRAQAVADAKAAAAKAAAERKAAVDKAVADAKAVAEKAAAELKVAIDKAEADANAAAAARRAAWQAEHDRAEAKRKAAVRRHEAVANLVRRQDRASLVSLQGDATIPEASLRHIDALWRKRASVDALVKARALDFTGALQLVGGSDLPEEVTQLFQFGQYLQSHDVATADPKDLETASIDPAHAAPLFQRTLVSALEHGSLDDVEALIASRLGRTDEAATVYRKVLMNIRVPPPYLGPLPASAASRTVGQAAVGSFGVALGGFVEPGSIPVDSPESMLGHVMHQLVRDKAWGKPWTTDDENLLRKNLKIVGEIGGIDPCETRPEVCLPAAPFLPVPPVPPCDAKSADRAYCDEASP